MARTLPGVLLVLGLVGCAHYPVAKELRDEARKDLTFRKVQQNPQAYQGALVIWGGVVLQTQNSNSGSDLYVLETPVAYQDHPQAARFAEGRFIARSPWFLDPEVYRAGARVAVAGRVAGGTRERVREGTYQYPLLQAEQVVLMPTPYSYAALPSWGWGWWGSPYAPFWLGEDELWGPWPGLPLYPL